MEVGVAGRPGLPVPRPVEVRLWGLGAGAGSVTHLRLVMEGTVRETTQRLRHVEVSRSLVLVSGT